MSLPFSHPQSPPNSQPLTDSLRLSRRRFAQHAAVLAACALSPGTALAAAPHHALPQSQPETFDLTPQQAEEVEAKLANIVRKYGNRLSQEQRTHLRHVLSYNEKMLASVHAFPLQNGDPPAIVLAISFQAEPPALDQHRASLGFPLIPAESQEGKL